MDKHWVDTQKARAAKEAQAKRTELVTRINNANFLSERDKQDVITTLDKESGIVYSTFVPSAMLKLLKNHEGDDKFNYPVVGKFIRSIDAESYNTTLCKAKQGMDRYLDSEKVEFDGDIIITDPCYIMRAEHHGTKPLTKDDWAACNYGENMGLLGIPHYMTRDTIYGDWGCTVYNSDTKEPIGEFCADAGLVSVFLLDEVLKYNPDFDYHTERTWTTTLIPDFKGTVQFAVEHETGEYEEDTNWWKAGDKWEDFSVHVVGHGVNKKTGEPINFYSGQSSM